MARTNKAAGVKFNKVSGMSLYKARMLHDEYLCQVEYDFPEFIFKINFEIEKVCCSNREFPSVMVDAPADISSDDIAKTVLYYRQLGYNAAIGMDSIYISWEYQS